MKLQPLQAETLFAAQQVAAELFPWEHEHQLALPAALDPVGHAEFLEERGLVTVRAWTTHLAGGPVSGLATLYGYREQPEELWLAWFGLLPAVRGRGVGAQLLDWLIGYAQAQGKRTMRLWTTDEPEYAKAMALYTRRGFIPERHPPLPGEDWTTYVLSLGLDGSAPKSWITLPNRRELCGREAPHVHAAAA
ncbi:MAG: GNAT family N-acetyltransferase [Opitutae bacterium]|nr:GNAT family N-acetyltransferase [Opitutae bacterium]